MLTLIIIFLLERGEDLFDIIVEILKSLKVFLGNTGDTFAIVLTYCFVHISVGQIKIDFHIAGSYF